MKCLLPFYFRAKHLLVRRVLGNITSYSQVYQHPFCSGVNHIVCHKVFHKPVYFQNLFTISKHHASHVSTKVSEPVVLYTYDNTKYLRIVTVFGCAFAAFWLWTANNFRTMPILPPAKHPNNAPWYLKFDLVTSPAKKWFAVSVCANLGLAVLFFTWGVTTRSVGKLILDRGGKSVTIISYNPLKFKSGTTTKVDLDKMTCRAHRLSHDVVPMKVKGKLMYYLLHKEGVYHNGPLFDKTVGLSRMI